MAKAKYCNLCDRKVVAKKEWKWSGFFLTGMLPYIIWYYLFKKKQCPICGNKKLRKHTPEEAN